MSQSSPVDFEDCTTEFSVSSEFTKDIYFQCGFFGSNLEEVKGSYFLIILKIIVEFEIAELIT